MTNKHLVQYNHRLTSSNQNFNQWNYVLSIIIGNNRHSQLTFHLINYHDQQTVDINLKKEIAFCSSSCLS